MQLNICWNLIVLTSPSLNLSLLKSFELLPNSSNLQKDFCIYYHSTDIPTRVLRSRGRVTARSRTLALDKCLESQWSPRSIQMDISGINYLLLEKHSSRSSDAGNVEKMHYVQDDYSSLFINYAAVAWHEMRRAWRGDHSVASQSKSREPIMSWSTSCQDLLSQKEPFDGPVPLAKMVEFLVEVWEDDL